MDHLTVAGELRFAGAGAGERAGLNEPLLEGPMTVAATRMKLPIATAAPTSSKARPRRHYRRLRTLQADWAALGGALS